MPPANYQPPPAQTNYAAGPPPAPQPQADMKPAYGLLGFITLLAVIILVLSAVSASTAWPRPEAACHTVVGPRAAVFCPPN